MSDLADTHGEQQLNEPWPERSWIMAVSLGAIGLVFGLLVDHDYSMQLPVWRQVLATFLFVAGVAWVLVSQPRRLSWAAIFAVATGLVLANIGWWSMRYGGSSPSLFEWSFLAAVFAALIAAPLFQTVRDEGRWSFPYRTLHEHAWTDAVIGAAGLTFVGVSFLVTVLLGQLLNLIRLDFIEQALRENWFDWALAGTAFGAAAGILRESDRLLATLLKVVLVVLSVLAPVFAAGIGLFLVALPFTGLAPLWATNSATPILLFCAAGAMLFVNAVIGNGRESRSGSRILSIAALVLTVTALPLAVIAAVSMGLRIGQYGWTPERLWGAVAVAVALAYGTAYLWSVAKARMNFDDVVRPLNTKLAIGTCALAIFLAMPFVDFGAISTQSQLARLEKGTVSPEEFDYWALKSDFGPSGRRALDRLTTNSDSVVAKGAKDAATGENRWEAEEATRGLSRRDPVRKNLRMADGSAVSEELIRAVADDFGFCEASPCIAVPLGNDRYAIVGSRYERGSIDRAVIDTKQKPEAIREARETSASSLDEIPENASVEVRPIAKRQLYVNDQPVGDPFD